MDIVYCLHGGNNIKESYAKNDKCFEIQGEKYISCNAT